MVSILVVICIIVLVILVPILIIQQLFKTRRAKAHDFFKAKSGKIPSKIVGILHPYR